jgi:hypothetical protein
LLASAPPRPVTERWGGETYRALWQEAVAADPDYVLITSWNKWHEGSEIEPSVEYGSVMLNDTAGFARAFSRRQEVTAVLKQVGCPPLVRLVPPVL